MELPRGTEQILATYGWLQQQSMVRPEMDLLESFDRAATRPRENWSREYVPPLCDLEVVGRALIAADARLAPPAVVRLDTRTQWQPGCARQHSVLRIAAQRDLNGNASLETRSRCPSSSDPFSFQTQAVLLSPISRTQGSCF